MDELSRRPSRNFSNSAFCRQIRDRIEAEVSMREESRVTVDWNWQILEFEIEIWNQAWHLWISPLHYSLPTGDATHQSKFQVNHPTAYHQLILVKNRSDSRGIPWRSNEPRSDARPRQSTPALVPCWIWNSTTSIFTQTCIWLSFFSFLFTPIFSHCLALGANILQIFKR